MREHRVAVLPRWVEPAPGLEVLEKRWDEVNPPAALTGALAVLSGDRVRRRRRRAAEAAPQNVELKTVTRNGHPGEQLVELVERSDAELVVMGSRGRGRLTSGLLGSTSREVHRILTPQRGLTASPDLAGTAPAVGIAGYTFNGGWGWLTQP